MMTLTDKPLSIKESWYAIFKLFTKTFSKVWPLGLILGIVNIVLLKNPHLFNITIPIPFFPVSIPILTIVCLLLSIYIGMLLLHRIYIVGKERAVTFRKSCGFIWKRFFEMVFVRLLSNVVLGGGGVCIGLFIWFTGILPWSRSPYAGYISKFYTYFPYVFSFLLIWYIATIFILEPLVLFDYKGFFKTLGASYRLIWGNWWYTFIIVILPSLILAISQIIICLFIRKLFNGHVSFLSPGPDMSIHTAFVFASLPSAIIFGFLSNIHWSFSILFYMFFYPLFYSTVLIQFGNLKARKAKAREAAQLI